MDKVFRFYTTEDTHMENGYTFARLDDLNVYFNHTKTKINVHNLTLKGHGVHYKTRNTLFEVYNKKHHLLGYLELLK